MNNTKIWYLGWALIIVGAVFAGVQALKEDGLKLEWRRVAMDGHRTGAQPVTAENIPQALGTFTDEGYMCPSGACYMDDSSVAQEAAELLEVQPQLAHLKKVIGHSAGMYMNLRNQPDLPLGNLVADILRWGTWWQTFSGPMVRVISRCRWTLLLPTTVASGRPCRPGR